MRRLLVTLLLLLGCSAVASARDSVKGWCEEGNRPVVTSGLNSTTRVQASHPSCIVTVYVHGGGLATIYADNNNTPLANPFTAQSGGRWQAYANDGRYDVTMSSAGFSQTVTYSDIILCDPFAVGSTCNNGGSTTAHNLLSTTHLDTIPHSPPVRGDLITAQNTTSPSGVTPAWAALPIGTNGQVLTSTGIDAVWGNIVAGTNITITSVGGNTTINATGGGGSGCTLPVGGVLYGVVGENPKGTCDDSAKFTWDKADALWQAGDGTNTISDVNALSRIFGFGRSISVTSDDDPSTFGITDLFLNGSNIGITQTGASADIQFGVVLGSSSGFPAGVNAITGSNISQWMCLIDGCQNTGIGFPGARGLRATGASTMNVIFNVGLTNGIEALSASHNTSAFVIGENNKLIANNGCTLQDNFIYGEVHQLNCNTAGTATVDHTVLLGFTHSLTSTTQAIRQVFTAGDTNTITNSSGSNMLDVMAIGKSLTLTNCSDCYALGENVTTSTSNVFNIGMSANPEIQIAGVSATNGPFTQFAYNVANAGSTGTTVNKLAKLTGAPSTAVLAATTDTADIIGVVMAGAGTTGNALIAFGGMATCVFDGATTAGDYVSISATTAGDCHDAGASVPASGQVIGRVMSTNGGGGTYKIILNDMNMLKSSSGAGGVTTNSYAPGSDTLAANGTFATTQTITGGTATAGQVYEIYADGSEVVHGGAAHQFVLKLGSTSITLGAGSSQNTGTFNWTIRGKFVVTVAGASGSVVSELYSGQANTVNTFTLTANPPTSGNFQFWGNTATANMASFSTTPISVDFSTNQAIGIAMIGFVATDTAQLNHLVIKIY